MGEYELNNQELTDIVYRFFNELPSKVEVIDTSHGEKDFRETVIAEWTSGERYVLKIADNGFTFADRIHTWKRCGEEYRKCGYYCPSIICSKDGDFPTVWYKGHECVAYVEEYSRYRSLTDRVSNETKDEERIEKCRREAFLMTAVIAAKRLDFSDYPSGFCLFEPFSACDERDEVTDNALEWKAVADVLPRVFQEQVQRIWRRWADNYSELRSIYGRLPASVFQADLNPTNLLIDDDGEFRGVWDFNLCGREVYLNYLFREVWWIADEEDEIRYISDRLKQASSVYTFTDDEKRAALMLYRCIKPLWFTEVERLKRAGADMDAVARCLSDTEAKQTRQIDFEMYMA